MLFPPRCAICSPPSDFENAIEDEEGGEAEREENGSRVKGRELESAL